MLGHRDEYDAQPLFRIAGICALERSTQRSRMSELSSRVDWSLVGGRDAPNDDAAMGPPSFERFIAWLYNQSLVQVCGAVHTALSPRPLSTTNVGHRERP